MKKKHNRKDRRHIAAKTYDCSSKLTVKFEKFTRPNIQTLVKPPNPTVDTNLVLLTALKQVGLFLGGGQPDFVFMKMSRQQLPVFLFIIGYSLLGVG